MGVFRSDVKTVGSEVIVSAAGAAAEQLAHQISALKLIPDTNDGEVLSNSQMDAGDLAANISMQPCLNSSISNSFLGYESGIMGAQALVASLTINACLLVFFASICLVKVVTTRFAEKYSGMLTIRNLSEDQPWVIGKIVTEQLSTWILFLTSVYLLSTTDIIHHPFHGSGCVPIIGLAFSANVGRYLFRMMQDVYLCDQLSQWWVQSLHHLVSVFCYVTMAVYGENLMLGVVGILMEGNSVCFDTIWMFKKCDIQKHHKVYIRVAALSCVSTFILRLIIPTVAVMYAFTQQNPLAMHALPLAVLFLSTVFFLAMNVWAAQRSVSTLKKCYQAKKQNKMLKIVGSKVPELLDVPNSHRNILGYVQAFTDTFAENNCSQGMNSNLSRSGCKTEKLALSTLLTYQDLLKVELTDQKAKQAKPAGNRIEMDLDNDLHTPDQNIGSISLSIPTCDRDFEDIDLDI